MAQERQKPLLVADLLTTGMALLAYLIFIPRLSFVGASLGTLTTEVVSIACLHLVLRRPMSGFPRAHRAGRALLAGVLTGAILHLLKQSGLPVLVDAALGAAAYAGLLLMTGALSFSMLRSLLASTAGRT